ncbi:MAG: hypothetical protein II997_08170 [Clostridia bacterium]|nr:hypothetical protein [Clostridia bacterium]
MREYIKPELQVREIRVMENLAKTTRAGIALNWVKGQAPSTVYSLGLYTGSGVQPAAEETDETVNA